MDIDFLSFSPSLADILHLVTNREIVNCRLVSRRFDDVIIRNSLGMKRPQADMNITFVSDAIINFNLMNRKDYPSRDYTLWDVVITNERITFFDCKNQSILDHYATHNEVLEGEHAVAADIVQDETKEPMQSFQSKSLIEDLRSLFSILFLRYRFHKINIDPDNAGHTLTETSMDMICEISRKYKSAACVVKTSDIYSKPEKLVRALGAVSLELTLSNRNISDFIFPCVAMMSEHRHPRELFHSIHVSTTPDTFDSLQPLIDIVMDNFPFPWTEDDLFQSFSHIPGYRLPNEEETNDVDYKDVKFMIEPGHGGYPILAVQYNPKEKTLEFNHYEPPSSEDDDVDPDSDASND